jgi:Arc/MetJ family transcription regulator
MLRDPARAVARRLHYLSRNRRTLQVIVVAMAATLEQRRTALRTETESAASWRRWLVLCHCQTLPLYILVYIRWGVHRMKTVIDLDTDLTEQAARVLGTKTKKDTIHAALNAAIAADRAIRERRERLLSTLGSPDLADDEIMSAAWR